MTDEKCTNCQRLESELQAVKQERDHLRKLIAAVTGHSQAAAGASASEMSAGRVPQGHYAWLKGRNDLANEVLRILGQSGPQPKRGFSGFKLKGFGRKS